MPPRPNQRRISLDRIQILQSISTPLGFFVLVVLVVEVVFGIIAGLQQGPLGLALGSDALRVINIWAKREKAV
jgi:hypothetical protein